MSRVFERKRGEWWIDFKDAQGNRRRKKIGPNRRVAKEVLDGILRNVARRQHLGVIEDSAIAFDAFAEEWWRRVAPTLKSRTRTRWRGVLDKLIKAFPGSLRGITANAAEAYISARVAQGVQVSTINIEVGVLKHMLRRAVSWEYLSRNPFLDLQGGTLAGLKPFREPPGRTRFLSPEEIERVLAACSASKSSYLRPFVIIAINTGMRRNEILSLTRASVHWNNRLATLLETKNGEQGHVYLNDVAYGTLKHCRPGLTVDCFRSALTKSRCCSSELRSAPGSRTSGSTTSDTPSPPTTRWRALRGAVSRTSCATRTRG
jgi:integrase